MPISSSVTVGRAGVETARALEAPGSGGALEYVVAGQGSGADAPGGQPMPPLDERSDGDKEKDGVAIGEVAPVERHEVDALGGARAGPSDADTDTMR